MPRPRKNLDAFRDEIERQIINKHTQPQILRWLAGQGLIISRNTLSTQVNAWNISRYTTTASSDTILIAAIDAAFHTTHYDDQTITSNLIS
jgi:hypothetical protein